MTTTECTTTPTECRDQCFAIVVTHADCISLIAALATIRQETADNVANLRGWCGCTSMTAEEAERIADMERFIADYQRLSALIVDVLGR